MSIAQTNMIAKIAAVVAGLGLVAMSFVAAAPAKAATSTDLSAQIAALQAQLAALMAQAGGSSSASATFTMDLTIGSKGADVTALQNWLIGKGFNIAAGATGFFGAQTKAAVAAWQAANGITPAAGYFGPKSRAVANAGGSTSTGGSVSGLTGGAGKLKNVDSLGDVETDLHESDSATKVSGFSAEAQDSDIAIQRVDVNVTIGGTGSSQANKYIQTIALYQDGKKLASMDAAAGEKNGRVWSYRFSDVNGIVREGKTGNFYVEVTPVSSFSETSPTTLTVTIPADGVRAVDAEGVSETYSVDGGAYSTTPTISTATTGTLTINEGSDNPKSTTVKADINTTTDNVTLSSFNLKAKNNDITVHDLPVTVNTGGANVNDVVQSIALVSGGTTLKTKSFSSTSTAATVVFDNIDQTISKDSSKNFQIVATIRKVDAAGSNFTSGDTASTTVSGTVGAWDVEDANGDSVTAGGSLVSNQMTFQATGVTVTKVDASYTKTTGTTSGSGDSTQYSISFKVTAGDDDLYIPATIQKSSTGIATKVTWATTTSSNSGVTSSTIGSSLAAADSNSSDVSGSYFKVPAGTTRTFTLNITLTATSTGYTGVALTGVGYGTTTTPSNNYLTYTSGLDTFKTADVSMTTH